ncbi:MAG: hypothetical protein LBU74_08100 [Methanobacteriaceae archaeon]|jgi:hypothetical protein|nr:hypothetical protein [Candidatus Methanorudis spinitermitis]
MNKKNILILLFILTIAIGFSISTVSAATKTINIKNNDWKSFWNYVDKTPMDKYTLKKSGDFKIEVSVEYQNNSKKWAIKNMPKNYFKSIVLGSESKKKFKSAAYYLYDDKTGKYKKKLTFKPKFEYVEPGVKAYRIHKVYRKNHRYTCKKVVINY